MHRYAKDTILKNLFPPVLLRICVSVCKLKKSQPYHLPKLLHFLRIRELYTCERMKAQPLHGRAKYFVRIREQGVGVIPKIKQSHFNVI
jgi:hypothetical protein